MTSSKILLADDDFDDRTIIKDALDKVAGGADVIYFVEHGEAALNILEEDYERQRLPCLIVLDLNMPRMNGTETLRHIKADPRFHHIPVVIYSTSVNTLEKEKCLRLGAHSYVTKPISFRESLATARWFYEFCRGLQLEA